MNLVEQFQRELAKRLPYAKWITIGSNPNAPEGKKGGTPVQIGDGGRITKGPSGLKGKKIGSVDKDKPEAKKTDKPKAKPRAPKLSIQQASNELADRGYRLIPKPVRQDLKAGKTWYAVVSPDGTTKAMTGQEIAQFVADQRQQETDLKARMVNQVMGALGRKERYSRSPLAEMFQREFDRRLNYGRRKFREDDVNRDDDGKFAEKPGGKKAKSEPRAKPAAKATAEEKQAAADRKFEEMLATKSKADAAAFRKARADGIMIPPAWTDVVYHGKSEDARVWAEGRDAQGRKQQLENKAFRKRVSNENNARISRELKPRMDALRKRLRADAMAGNEEAKVLYLIAMTGFRIGGKGDGKAKEKAYGATTLLGDHVSVKGDTVTFDFPGKKGVRQQHTITDPVIAQMMKGAKKGEPVFSTRDAKVRAAWQQQYGGKNVHDIRHVVATEVAEREIAKRVPPYPKTEREQARLMNEISAVSAAKLGNNLSQARDTYIDPAIWNLLKGKS